MESTIQFIEVVRRHEPIYDTTHRDYKNMERKAQAWSSVAQEVGLTVDAAKRKWKNLRDSYTKYLRSFRTGTKTSRKYQYWAHAEHMEFLRPFQGPGRSHSTNSDVTVSLDNYRRNPSLSIEDQAVCDIISTDLEEIDEKYQPLSSFDDDLVITTTNSLCTNKRIDDGNNTTFPSGSNSNRTSNEKIGKVCSLKNKSIIKAKDLDATALLFLSLAKTVRCLPRKLRAEVKMRCMKIVTEAEIQAESIKPSSGMDSTCISSSSSGHFPNGDNDHNNTSVVISAIPESTGICKNDSIRQQQLNSLNYSNSNNGGQSLYQLQPQSVDNSEHFLYVMSPSRVEAMIDLSSDVDDDEDEEDEEDD